VKRCPFVSVIVAVRNDEKYIKECLDSLTGQDYPAGRYEILVVDGRSMDGTREIVANYSKVHHNVRSIDNPRINAAAGRNIGIAEARGKILIMFSGHAYAERNFISNLALKLAACDEFVVGVGCGHETPPGDPYIARSIGLAMGSRFGGYGTTFLRESGEKFVDSIAFTAYRKDVFEKVGPHDERFVVGQDGELNLRIKKAGYRLLYTPETIVYHHKKDSILKFFKHMFEYGRARAKMLKKHRGSFRPIYIFPSLFVLTLIFLGLLSPLHRFIFYMFLLLVGAYLACALASAALVSSKHGLKFMALLPAIYFIEHIGYGLGFLSGYLGGGQVGQGRAAG